MAAVNYTGLVPYVARVARVIPKAGQLLGFQAKVTSGYRSPTYQAQLYKKFLLGQMPYTVAPPGTSPHEKGLALDIVATNQKKLTEFMQALGFTWAGKADPVHYSLYRILETGKTKPKKTIVGKVLSVASWIPGPIGLAASGAKLFGVK